MLNKTLYNYYEIDQYCRSEGLNTEYFIQQIVRKKKSKMKRFFLAALLTFKR